MSTTTKAAVEMLLDAVAGVGATAPHPELLRMAKHGDSSADVTKGAACGQ
jgi:hypothetical protein